jgi:hypothetical protein
MLLLLACSLKHKDSFMMWQWKIRKVQHEIKNEEQKLSSSTLIFHVDKYNFGFLKGTGNAEDISTRDYLQLHKSDNIRDHRG